LEKIDLTKIRQVLSIDVLDEAVVAIYIIGWVESGEFTKFVYQV
jgi:hypothetical protein